MENVTILPESKIRQIFREEQEAVLKRLIPSIVRRATCKKYLTTKELEELTGMSPRMQKYHRDAGNLPYSQEGEGRKIIYSADDVDKFILERRIEV